MSVMKSFLTKKGTELPILNLRGKPYLQVAHRLVWFEEENPNYHISNDYLRLTDTEAIVKTTVIIIDDKGQATRKVSATKKETVDGFPDFVEKAESSSLGRALAMLGYGTQFAPDLDESERLADSPIDVAKKVPVVKAAPKAETVNPEKELVVEKEATVTPIAKPSFRPKKVESKNGDLF